MLKNKNLSVLRPKGFCFFDPGQGKQADLLYDGINICNQPAERIPRRPEVG